MNQKYSLYNVCIFNEEDGEIVYFNLGMTARGEQEARDIAMRELDQNQYEIAKDCKVVISPF